MPVAPSTVMHAVTSDVNLHGDRKHAHHTKRISAARRGPSRLVFVTIELISPPLAVPERQMERARRGLERLTWCGCARYTV